MRWLNLVVLIGLAVAFAAGNLWFAARRSTIPLSLQEAVERVETRREKHPGKDDVFLVYFRSGRRVQVDEAVARLLVESARIAKQPWRKSVRIDDVVHPLKWSADVHGMLPAMPLLLVIFAVTVAWSTWLGKPMLKRSR